MLSDLNAFIGLQTVHGSYPNLNPGSLPSTDHLVPLTTSQDYYANGGMTHYYMITNDQLPILEPVKAIPLLGTPLYDLFKPDMTMLVNLGYGDPHYGYSTAPADVATQFGVLPHYNQLTLAQDLFTGAQQGATAFTADIKSALPVAAANLSLPNLEHAFASATGGSQPAPGVGVGAGVARQLHRSAQDGEHQYHQQHYERGRHRFRDPAADCRHPQHSGNHHPGV